MPINYLRGFTAPERTDATNRRLGRSLAFVAGAANAGGFLAVGQYTSHMSGIVSSLADNAALGDASLFVAGLSSLLAFLMGAATSAVLINGGVGGACAVSMRRRSPSKRSCCFVSGSSGRISNIIACCLCRRPSACCVSSWACRTR
ncbi:hypothetical protein QFZ39_001467 [Paraburkholderia graminis]|nr:hypothetical protein [Paraburkholderia graminis]